MILELTDGAVEDITAAALEYEEARPGLGFRFEDEVARLLRQIADAPVRTAPRSSAPLLDRGLPPPKQSGVRARTEAVAASTGSTQMATPARPARVGPRAAQRRQAPEEDSTLEPAPARPALGRDQPAPDHASGYPRTQ